MHRVEPQVYVIGETTVDGTGLHGYLEHIGATGWESDAATGVEEVVEVMGRGCYKSFAVGLNPNVTRVRSSNADHLHNLVKQQHGSVLEHGWVSLQLCDVSRVVTHELVRHRAGVAISQESLRYVRLEDLGMWLPSCYANNPAAVKVFTEHWQACEQAYKQLIDAAAEQEHSAFDDLPFEVKKAYTSAARRVAPEGLATNIGWSANLRALRHIIEMRTDPSAEEEIRLLFSKIAGVVIPRYPAVFADYQVTAVNGINHYHTTHRKI